MTKNRQTICQRNLNSYWLRMLVWETYQCVYISDICIYIYTCENICFVCFFFRRTSNQIFLFSLRRKKTVGAAVCRDFIIADHVHILLCWRGNSFLIIFWHQNIFLRITFLEIPYLFYFNNGPRPSTTPKHGVVTVDEYTGCHIRPFESFTVYSASQYCFVRNFFCIKF